MITGKKDHIIFKDYGEYFHHTRPLSLYQKTKLFDNFHHELKYSLETSYLEDGWYDLIEANLFDQKVEMIKRQFNKDLYQIRSKINQGLKIRVKEVFWKFVQQELSEISDSRKEPLIGGIVYMRDPKDRKWIILKKG